nr:S8 family serine peptidase [Pleionea sp. CnH1-48]
MVQGDKVSDANTASVKVCITDTGYDRNHEDLRPYNGSNISGSDNTGTGYDTGDWYNDGHGHGTHVAGTIAAIGNNGVGVVGVNPSDQVGLHIVKVFNDSGNWAYGSDMAVAVEQCINSGAKVISMSLGGGGQSSSERAAFQDAYDNGVLLIAASGNDGTASGNDAFSFPASYDMVMSVAAIDRNKNVANFSQKNSQVEIAAPGVNVNSTLPGNRYAAWSGTSMATPHVSAVAALVWSHFPSCTNADIRQALNATAQDLGANGRDQAYGFGLVQAKSAYDYLNQNGCSGGNGGGGGGGQPGDDELTNGQSVSTSAAKGEELHYYVDVPAGASNLSISLSGGSGDADLYVKSGAKPSVSSYDCRPYKNGNNETCVIDQPNTGRYQIMLRGYAAFSGANLKVSYDESNGGGNAGGEFTDSNLYASRGQWLYYVIDVPAGTSELNVNITGGYGDADLYLNHGQVPGTNRYACRPYKNGNNEACTIRNPQAGKWYIGLRAYRTFYGLSLSGKHQ